MSRKTVRYAIAALLQPPAIANLNVVFKGEPRRIDSRLIFPTPGIASGAAAFPYLAEEVEHRESPPSSLGQRSVRYKAYLVIRFMSNQALNEDAEDDYDDLIENIKAYLRANPRLDGSVSTLLQAAEGWPPGTPAISHKRHGLAWTEKGVIHISGELSFACVEWIPG